jgi:hypothetical protein
VRFPKTQLLALRLVIFTKPVVSMRGTVGEVEVGDGCGWVAFFVIFVFSH